jgi:hypothetical protein
VEEQLARRAQEAGGSFERGDLSLSSSRQEEMLTESGQVSPEGLEDERELPVGTISDTPLSAVDKEPSSSESTVRTRNDHIEL